MLNIKETEVKTIVPLKGLECLKEYRWKGLLCSILLRVLTEVSLLGVWEPREKVSEPTAWDAAECLSRGAAEDAF